MKGKISHSIRYSRQDIHRHARLMLEQPCQEFSFYASCVVEEDLDSTSMLLSSGRTQSMQDHPLRLKPSLSTTAHAFSRCRARPHTGILPNQQYSALLPRLPKQPKRKNLKALILSQRNHRNPSGNRGLPSIEP